MAVLCLERSRLEIFGVTTADSTKTKDAASDVDSLVFAEEDSTMGDLFSFFKCDNGSKATTCRIIRKSTRGLLSHGTNRKCAVYLMSRK